MTESEAESTDTSASRESARIVDVDETVFPVEVVLKATYWMTGRYDVEVKRDARRGCLCVEFRGLDGLLSEENANEAERRLRRDLIDFRTRMLIDQETRVIRDLLVAKAFDDGVES